MTAVEAFGAGDLEALLDASGARRQGHFQLSSGLHSSAYVQCALLLEDPRRARRVGRALARRIGSLRPDSVLAPALGGLLIGHEVAAALGVPFRFTERKDGAMALRRGFQLRPGERVVIVEDVITTGKSTEETAVIARAAGAAVVAVAAIIDRTGGKHPFTVPFVALTTFDLPAVEPADCPLCRAGVPVEKPGSRPFGLFS